MRSYTPTASLDLLLYKLFDYAGMFPPAQRSFPQALQESASLASTLQRPWMVASDLVLDTEHTRALAAKDLAAAGFSSPPSICVLATEDFSGVQAAIEALQSVGVNALEIKVNPENIATILATYGPLARSYQALLACEPDLSGSNWQEVLRQTVDNIASAQSVVALKCRCSGPTGVGLERLAAAIARACDAGIPFKVTGGLHHPIVEPGRYPFLMGFLNVAAAVMLRRALGGAFSEELIALLLQNSSLTDLGITSGIRFLTSSISHEQLMQAKSQLHLSIGSCSLHEPDSDLLRLFPDGSQ